MAITGILRALAKCIGPESLVMKRTDWLIDPASCERVVCPVRSMGFFDMVAVMAAAISLSVSEPMMRTSAS